MKQFGKILKFELMGFLTNKAFIGITLFLVIASAVLTSIPRLKPLFSGDSDGAEGSEKAIMLICADESIAPVVKETFAAAFAGYDVQLAQDGVEQLEDRIMNGEAECAFLIEDFGSYTYYVGNLSMYDNNTAIADEVMLSLLRMDAMAQAGVSPEDAQGILMAQVSHEVRSLGKDQMHNFFYTYIMIFALYMVILLYGQMVATNVATEKSSRAMELLITSADPVSMMFGKVLASCIAGFAQLAVIFGSAFAFYNMNREYMNTSGNMGEILGMFFDIPMGLVLYMLLFFVLGFLIFAFLFGAIGSTVSKLEDINTSVQPVTFTFLIGFMVVMFSMSSGNVDTLLMKVCSFIPFTSPMAMFTRIAMSTVPGWEIVVSVAILVVSTCFIGVVSAKIYRIGVLLYGTPPKPRAIIKAIRKS
ncbi:MAG: ABC transporter permease [Oscillospiraceae bacterium]|nr:ABC transporter permease [Oscillospiraceae bacterium]